MPILIFKLLGIWSWIKRMAAAAFNLATRYPWQAALIAALLWGAWERHGKGNARDERDAALAQVEQIKAAGEQARAAQIALNQATEARYRAEAEKTDHDHQIALEGALRASERYAATHRVRAYCERSPGQASAPAQGPDTPRDNRPGDDADMVAVSRQDFDTLTENTLRLKAAHDWSQSLIDQGLAEPAKPVAAVPAMADVFAMGDRVGIMGR